MEYELYIDLFFVENLVMDYLILLLLRKILKNPAKDVRIFLGAVTGSLMTCLLFFLPASLPAVRTILLHAAAGPVMLVIGLEIRGIRQFFKAFLFLYISGMLFGGVMGWLSQYLRTGILFGGLAILGYWISMGIWTLLETQGRISQSRCVVRLYKGDKSCRVRALIDTGNLLWDAHTGKPVSIITPAAAVHLDLSGLPGNSEHMRFITYSSVGNSKGILPIFCIDKMCVLYQGKRRYVCSPILAVCREELNSEEYQMILNPKILEREEK